MLRILLAQVEDAMKRSLAEALGRVPNSEVVVATTAEEGLNRISADPAAIAALVVGATPEPVDLAQRVHALDRDLSIVLLPGAHGPDLRDRLRLVPHVGEDVSSLDTTDVDALVQGIVDAAERRRQRQAYARTVATLNPQIDGAARPPQVAGHLGRLLDQAPIGVLTVDRRGVIHGVNRHARTLLGAKHNLVGEAFPQLVAAADRERTRDTIDRALRDAPVAAITLDRSDVQGRPQSVELSALRVEIGPERPGAILLLQDVTEREQARVQRDRTEQTLHEQRRWFEATVRSIGDAVIATDPRGRVTLMNGVAEQLTGWPQDLAVGRDSREVFRIVNESTRDEVESPVTRVLREGVIAGLANHTVLLSRDGCEYPIDDSGAPIRGDDGAMVGVVLVFRDVGERRQTERALRESERRFRAIFDQAAMGIALVSPDRRMLQVNERFCRIVGYEREELLAMDDPVTTLTHPGDRIVEPSSPELADNAPVQVEKRYLHKQGHEVWARLTASPLRDDAGRVRQLIGVVEDIDERKRAEAALQASEQRLRLVLESLTDYAIFTMDLERRVTGWNAGAERLLGYEEAEIMGRPADVIFPEEDRRAGVPAREIRRALRQGQASDDRWHVRKDGSRFWANGLVNTLGPPGQPQGLVKILRDQTESKRSQQQLEARARQQAAVAQFGQRALSSEDLRSLLEEAVRNVARTLDIHLCKALRLLPEGQELQVEAVSGWDPELVGRARVGAARESQSGYTLLTDQPVVIDDLRTETRFSSALLTDAGVISGMSVVVAGAGDDPWGVLVVHTREHRQFTSDDVNFLQAMANTLAAAVQRDRSLQQLHDLNQSLEQRVAERTAEAEHRAAQLRALTSELTQTEQRERRRLAQILHDHLQQMLVAGKLQIGNLPDTLEDPRAAGALKRVRDLLDQSIEESRSLTRELSPPVLYEAGLVAGLEWLGRWIEEQHGLAVELRTEDGADPVGEDLRVVLFQSARELLFNVVKHAGTERAEITLRRDEAERIELSITDRGRGFEPGDAPGPETEGNGFGLFSIRERIAWLGGVVEIDSSLAGGTRAVIAVPESARRSAAAVAGEQEGRTATATPAPLAEHAQPGPAPQGVIRVVLADDHEILREGLVGVLSAQPDVVVVGEAGDGQEALEMVRRTHPDAVVLDVTMPRMNGVEAARAINAEFPNIRVIGLSVHESADMAEAMHRAGAVEYLNKAEPSNRLLAAIRGRGT